MDCPTSVGHFGERTAAAETIVVHLWQDEIHAGHVLSNCQQLSDVHIVYWQAILRTNLPGKYAFQSSLQAVRQSTEGRLQEVTNPHRRYGALEKLLRARCILSHGLTTCHRFVRRCDDVVNKVSLIANALTDYATIHSMHITFSDVGLFRFRAHTRDEH